MSQLNIEGGEGGGLMDRGLQELKRRPSAGGHSLGGQFPVVASSMGGEGLGDEGLWSK